MWTAGLGSAITIKLSSSIDDVVWLAPFLTSNAGAAARAHNAMTYISVCFIQTVVAMVIAYSGDSVVSWLVSREKNAWSSDKILTVGAGSLMAIYSAKLAYEYIAELQEGRDTEEHLKQNHKASDIELEDTKKQIDVESRTPSRDFEVDDRNGETDEKSETDVDRAPALDHLLLVERGSSVSELQSAAGSGRHKPNAEKGRTQTLFVIALLGSMDDLTLFVPMLVGKGFDFTQLTLGALIASSAIVLLCFFVGLCKPVANILSNIPLALIVTTFAMMLLIKGSMMH